MRQRRKRSHAAVIRRCAFCTVFTFVSVLKTIVLSRSAFPVAAAAAGTREAPDQRGGIRLTHRREILKKAPHVPNFGPHFFLDPKEYVSKLRTVCNETTEDRHYFVVEDCKVVRVDNQKSYESRYRSIRSIIDKALSQACPTRLRNGRIEFCVFTGDIDESHAMAFHEIPVFAPATTRRQIGNLIPAPDHVFNGWPEARSGIESYTKFYTQCRGMVGVASSASGNDDASSCNLPWSSRREQLVWAGMPTHDRRLKYKMFRGSGMRNHKQWTFFEEIDGHSTEKCVEAKKLARVMKASGMVRLPGA